MLIRVFRGKFKDALQGTFQQHQISFHGQLSHLADPKHFARFIQSLYRQKWVVYAKPPFGGPEHVEEHFRCECRFHNIAGMNGAAILSIVESCRRLKLPLRDYLADVLPGLAELPMPRIKERTPSAWAASRI